METMNTGTCVQSERCWLDKTAIIMAFVCGVHCLATPLLIFVLPIIGQTFWTSGNFHFWMLLLVIPTTGLAVFSGCRKHGDKRVGAFAVAGLCFLVAAVVVERAPIGSSHSTMDAAECASEGSCCSAGASSGNAAQISSVFPSLSIEALSSVIGGSLLIAGHLRNFRLCRSKRCCAGRRL